MIDASAAWQTFLAASKKAMSENKGFESPHRSHSYSIIEVDTLGVRVKTKEATTNRKPKIRIDLFTRSMTRMNSAGGKLRKTKMCRGNVLFETVIVELLPMLSWDKEKRNIIETIIPGIVITTGITAKKVKETANRDVTVRRGQGKLRDELIRQYGGRCCITGCTVQEILYAAHIIPYSVSFDNTDTNALLLKSDIHDLYDAYLLGISPHSFKVVIAEKIKNEYGHLEGVVLNGRKDKKPPDATGMLKRWQKFIKNK